MAHLILDKPNIDLLIDDAAAANKVGLSCYPVINPVRANAPLRRDGKTSGATDADIIAARFCWADGDDEAALNVARGQWKALKEAGAISGKLIVI